MTVHKLLVVLLLNELLESVFVHISHQLIEDLGVIESHILQELRELIDGNSHGLALSADDFNELDRLMVLPVLQVVAQLHLLDRVHHTLHVLRVINAVVVVSKRVQVVVWLRVVVLVIRYKLIILLW